MPEFTVLNPATEEPVATVAQASPEQADEAIAAAAAAQRGLAGGRARRPGPAAALVRRGGGRAAEELAGLEVAGSGHPIGAARWEAGHVRDVLLYYSAAPERLIGKQIPVPGGLNVTFQEPLGVVGLIVPWNFPMPILSWGMAPALAAGNTVVAKPAEATPLTAMRIGELALEAGPARGRVPGAARQGQRGRAAAGRPPRGPEDRVHRVHRGRPLDHGGLRAAGEAGHAGARRQERQHHLRRRRPGAGRGHRAVRGVRQRRAGLLRPVPDPGTALGPRPVHGAVRARGARRRGR